MSGGSIAVNYGEMENAATQIKNSSKTIEDISAQLKSQLDKMMWEGSDQAAYKDQERKWNEALAGMNTILHQISSAVETARSGYSDVEQQGVRAWG